MFYLTDSHRSRVHFDVDGDDEHESWVLGEDVGESDAYIEEIKRKSGLLLVQKDRIKASYRDNIKIGLF